MKKIVIPIRLPEHRNIGIELPEGGVPKGIVLGIEKVSNLLATGGKQAVREMVSLIVECEVEDDENGQIKDPVPVKRNFLACRSGQVVDEEELIYIDSVPSTQSGALIHVFEFTPKPS